MFFFYTQANSKVGFWQAVQNALWGDSLWSPSYFAGACGGTPLEIIRQYIEQQETPTL